MPNPTPQPDIDELRKKILNRLMDNVGHTDEDYETCRSHYSICSKCDVETYHFKYYRHPKCSHAKKDQLPQSCNCSNGKQAKKDTAYIISLLTTHTEKALSAADRKTLETLSSILHSAKDPVRNIEIADSYILNKLLAKEPTNEQHKTIS